LTVKIQNTTNLYHISWSMEGIISMLWHACHSVF
jgi:hypothetical protein